MVDGEFFFDLAVEKIKRGTIKYKCLFPASVHSKYTAIYFLHLRALDDCGVFCFSSESKKSEKRKSEGKLAKSTEKKKKRKR